MKEKLLNHFKISTNKNNAITYSSVVVLYLAAMILSSTGILSNQLQGLLIPICAYAILAVSLNLTVGVLGELSLGHAGFMCIGAFVGGAFSIAMKSVITVSILRFIIAIILGAIVAAIMGFLIGLPVLRLRGDYLAIVTLAFGEIIKNIVQAIYLGIDENGVHFSMQSTEALGMSESGTILIKGAQGIVGTPQDSSFTFGIILVIITLFIVLNLMNSRDGRAIMSIRDNEIASESVGINVTKYKLMAFTISASLAGAAGVLYAHCYSSVMASKFNYNMSILILVFVVLGGIANMRGSVYAAIILTMLPEVLRFMNKYRMLVYAIVLIAMMLLNWSPKGQQFKEKMAVKIKGILGKKAKEEK